ncbi:unnamed protein product [Nesidiocoris tenuis]|uniref:Uncharacterized protein n=1 Tax=Nesidiocoris tenuis TaxID=355587 RepID=A0A6H5G9X4_9HEMI|nr:unnamed protein product [Nesidiocoris tenuis]
MFCLNTLKNRQNMIELCRIFTRPSVGLYIHGGTCPILQASRHQWQAGRPTQHSTGTFLAVVCELYRTAFSSTCDTLTDFYSGIISSALSTEPVKCANLALENNFLFSLNYPLLSCGALRIRSEPGRQGTQRINPTFVIREGLLQDLKRVEGFGKTARTRETTAVRVKHKTAQPGNPKETLSLRATLCHLRPKTKRDGTTHFHCLQISNGARTNFGDVTQGFCLNSSHNGGNPGLRYPSYLYRS